MNELRPIGTEFWLDWIQDLQSSSEERRILYKVVEIIKVHKFGTYGELIEVERVEPIKKETRSVNFLKLKLEG